MEEKASHGATAVVIIIAVIWIWSNYSKIGDLESTNSYLEDSLSDCQISLDDYQSALDDYQSALEQANNNIEEANSLMDDARTYAWSSYQEMGDALENLYMVDTISEP